MQNQFVIYGANGYTGALVAREAVTRGLRPILAGRNAAALATLAGELGLDYRVVALDDPAGLDNLLAGVTAVLHCAGPFVFTSQPMADACLRNAFTISTSPARLASTRRWQHVTPRRRPPA
jgi:short subunit dehydrogenase-like uncharacterized protein